MVKVHLIGHGKWGAVIDNAIGDSRYVEWTDSKRRRLDYIVNT